MMQKQIAFEETKLQQEALTLSDNNSPFLCQLHGYDAGLKSFILQNVW
jgi:hypothetical protein